MQNAASDNTPLARRWKHPALPVLVVLVGAAVAGLTPLSMEARTLVVCVTALTLWLLELTPAFVPTLVLLTLAPLTLAMPEAKVPALLQAGANPVLLLFFSGFCLALATNKTGTDRALTRYAMHWSRGNMTRLTFAMMVVAAALSMWMSNMAAAALLFAALGGVLKGLDHGPRVRLLVSIAMASSIGGMVTPIGTGPNAIALAEAAPYMRIAFIHWMLFALPLAAFLLLIAFLFSRAGNAPFHTETDEENQTFARDYRLYAIGGITVAAWLSEPLHGIPSAVVGAGCCSALFLSGLLDRSDLAKIDWATLLLVAGGLMVGTLLEASGALHHAIAATNMEAMPPLARDFLLVFAAAFLSALMSNTATAAILIPLTVQLAPSASSAVLVAIATSLGMPFIISTPPNAMAHALGASSRDLLRVGLPLMLIGALVVGLTGRTFLNLIGVP